MPVASLLQHHKRIQSSDLSARGNDSGGEGRMGVGLRKGVKGEEDWQGRAAVFRTAVASGGFYELG